MRPILALAMGVVSIAPAAAQTTHLVPEQFPTIQAAVDVAIDGDTVLVSPGVYVETVNLQKEITITSRRGPRATIVDAAGQGRVFWIEGAPVLRGLTIRGGFADVGAGIYVNDGNVRIQDCIVRDNFATNEGGGIYVWFNFIELTSSVVCRNGAGNEGAGIFAFGFGMPRIAHCTIVQNRVVQPGAQGAGVHFVNEAFSIHNSIVRDNLSGGLPAPPINLPNPTFVIESCNFEGSAAFHGSGHIDADPLFVDAAGGDFHLTSASPCRDTGLSNPWFPVPPTDFEGDPRSWGAGADMGADELHPHLYVAGDLTPGAAVHVRLVGEPAGTQAWGYLSTMVQEPPTMTPFGDWWLMNRRVRLFEGATVPANGVLDVAYVLPPSPPAPLALYVQGFDGAAVTNLDSFWVE